MGIYGIVGGNLEWFRVQRMFEAPRASEDKIEEIYKRWDAKRGTRGARKAVRRNNG